MDFIDQLRALAARISRQIPMIATEEATVAQYDGAGVP
jgi:hypothetical protein